MARSAVRSQHPSHALAGSEKVVARSWCRSRVSVSLGPALGGSSSAKVLSRSTRYGCLAVRSHGSKPKDADLERRQVRATSFLDSYKPKTAPALEGNPSCHSVRAACIRTWPRAHTVGSVALCKKTARPSRPLRARPRHANLRRDHRVRHKRSDVRQPGHVAPLRQRPLPSAGLAAHHGHRRHTLHGEGKEHQ